MLKLLELISWHGHFSLNMVGCNYRFNIWWLIMHIEIVSHSPKLGFNIFSLHMLSIKWCWLDLPEPSLQNIWLRPPPLISKGDTLGLLSNLECACALLVGWHCEWWWWWCQLTLLDFLDLLWSSLLSWDLGDDIFLAQDACFIIEYLLTCL